MSKVRERENGETVEQIVPTIRHSYLPRTPAVSTVYLTVHQNRTSNPSMIYKRNRIQLVPLAFVAKQYFCACHLFTTAFPLFSCEFPFDFPYRIKESRLLSPTLYFEKQSSIVIDRNVLSYECERYGNERPRRFSNYSELFSITHETPSVERFFESYQGNVPNIPYTDFMHRICQSVALQNINGGHEYPYNPLFLVYVSTKN